MKRKGEREGGKREVGSEGGREEGREERAKEERKKAVGFRNNLCVCVLDLAVEKISFAHCAMF